MKKKGIQVCAAGNCCLSERASTCCGDILPEFLPLRVEDEDFSCLVSSVLIFSDALLLEVSQKEYNFFMAPKVKRNADNSKKVSTASLAENTSCARKEWRKPSGGNTSLGFVKPTYHTKLCVQKVLGDEVYKEICIYHSHLSYTMS